MLVRRSLTTLTVGVTVLACTSGIEPGRTSSITTSADTSESGDSSESDTGDPPPETGDEFPAVPDEPALDTDPPVIQAFTVNGGSMPAAVEDAAFVELAAVVVDDTGLDLVEFRDGNQVLITLEVAPEATDFAHSWLVSGEEFNGNHAITVRAVDLAGNEAVSEPIELVVEQPPSGLKRWSILWDGGFGEADRGDACALTPQDRLVVGGAATDADGLYRDAHVEAFTTASGSLTTGWAKPVVADGNADAGQARVRSISRFLDGDDLALAGTQGLGMWVARYSDNGIELWKRGDFFTESTDYVDGVAAGFGHIFVAGTSSNAGYLVAYDEATGDAVGQFVVDNGALRDVAMFDGGEVVTVGEQADDIYLARVTPELELVWETTVDGGAGEDEASAVAVHPNGTIAVGGSMRGVSTGLDLWLATWEPDGTLRWTAPKFDYAGGTDRIAGLAIDPLERVVITGRVTTNPMLPAATHGDIYVVSYDAIGFPRWATLPIAGVGDVAETGAAVCLDEVGNIYVVGELFDQQHYDWWVARYAP